MSDAESPLRRKRWRPVPRSWLDAQRRESDLIRREASKIRGLLPLLMKHRNGQRWTPQERQELMQQFHMLAHLSPYVVILILPGSFIALPALAWWLDRRRQQRG